MSTPPSSRSVKISDDERGGWSSDRPRQGPPRAADISTRCKVLAPTDSLRYSPGSLLVIVSPSPGAASDLADRLIQSKGALMSLDKVRQLLQGRVGEDQLEDKARELLDAAIRKRLEAGDTVVLPLETLALEEAEPYVRAASGLRRPRHVILVEPAGADVGGEDRAVVDDLRKRLVAGDLGQEGFQTAMRLAGTSIAELKRIVFERPPRDD
jgi:hypothetical protein